MSDPIETESADGAAVVRVSCRLDAEGSEPLAQEFDRLLRAGEHVVRLDLAGVGFISSAGIGTLVAAHRKLHAAGGRLTVVAASPQVAGVLRLTKLDTLIGPTVTPVQPTSAASAATADRTVGPVRLVAVSPPRGRSAAVRAVSRGAVPRVVALSSGSFALGLGTPDADTPHPRAYAGEVLAAAGCLFHRPPATDPRIDWMVPAAGQAVRLALVEGLAWDADPAGSAGFEPTAADGTVPLDDLARGLLAASGGSAIAFVAVGEIHGLVGAELVRPLAEATAADHPWAGTAAVAARWLSFSREPVHPRRTAILVGVAASGPPADAAVAAALRPLDAAGDAGLVGHVHAAVFPFRPQRREPGDPAQLVAALAATPPLAVLHLLTDPAPLVGSGRSEFVRGVAWFWPLAALGGGAA